MQASLKQSKQEINAFAIKNKKQLEPEIKHSENLIKQIDSLNLQLNEIKNDLEENVNFYFKKLNKTALFKFFFVLEIRSKNFSAVFFLIYF